MSTQGLWQISFELPAAPAIPILEALEEDAASVAIFEIEADENQDTTRWRVEMLHQDKPEQSEIVKQLKSVLCGYGLVPENLGIDFIAHEDWLTKAAMPRPPQTIGRFYIHGENDPAPTKNGLVSLTIDVGMAFGSGEHGSTAGCLLAFDQLLRRRKFASVLDLGCGSAILGIAAAKTGRSKVMAADNDPLAVEVARRNAAINHVSNRLDCLVSDGYQNPKLRRHAPFDLIFANILADPLCALARGLKRHLAPGGYAILAGLLDRQADMVVAAHRREGLRHVISVDMLPWRTLILKRPG